MTEFAADGFHDGKFRLKVSVDGQETLAEGTTASCALRDAADRVERIEYEEDGEEVRADGGQIERISVEEEGEKVLCINCHDVFPCDEAEGPVDIHGTADVDGEEVVHEVTRHYCCSQDCITEFSLQAVGESEAMTDGGTPSLPQVIADVLEDGEPGGLDRQVLIERVAEISGATLDEVEEVLGGELRRGAVIESGGEIKQVPNRRLVGSGRP